MKYHGMTVTITNSIGSQVLGVDSLSADLLLKRMPSDKIAYIAQDGDVITLIPYVQETTWIRILIARFQTWIRYRRAEKRLRQVEERIP